MKRTGLGGAVIVALLFSCVLLVTRSASSQTATPPGAGLGPGPVNFNAVAILRWYPANQTTTFLVGSNPSGIAFDGEHMWVANSGGGTVTELQASTGATIGTFAAGSNPYGVAFDGSNIWVVNQTNPGTVTKLQASSGNILGTFPVGAYPLGILFDGANIWVANAGKFHVFLPLMEPTFG